MAKTPVFKPNLLFLSFHVAEQRAFRGQVHLHTPATAQAGATVTLTLTVHAFDSEDSNYAVTYLTVVPIVRPYCDEFGDHCLTLIL